MVMVNEPMFRRLKQLLRQYKRKGAGRQAVSVLRGDVPCTFVVRRAHSESVYTLFLPPGIRLRLAFGAVTKTVYDDQGNLHRMELRI